MSRGIRTSRHLDPWWERPQGLISTECFPCMSYTLALLTPESCPDNAHYLHIYCAFSCAFTIAATWASASAGWRTDLIISSWELKWAEETIRTRVLLTCLFFQVCLLGAESETADQAILPSTLFLNWLERKGVGKRKWVESHRSSCKYFSMQIFSLKKRT